MVLWCDTLELASYYPSDTKNFEVAPRFKKKNLWTHIMRRKLVLVLQIERCYILYINSVSETVGQEVMHLCLSSEALCEVRNCIINVSSLQCGMAVLCVTLLVICQTMKGCCLCACTYLVHILGRFHSTFYVLLHIKLIVFYKDFQNLMVLQNNITKFLCFETKCISMLTAENSIAGITLSTETSLRPSYWRY